MARPKRIGRIEEALASHKETRSIEFKQAFNPSETRDWCELLKDLMAILNSGGGVIVFGLDNSGKPAGRDITAIASLDPAKITDKLESYTGVQFEEFRLTNEVKNGQPVVCLELLEADTPLVPTKPGTFPSAADVKKQERAFSAGVVYVRHGAKSEAANTWDLRKLIERKISLARKDVLHGVRKITKAPTGSKIDVLVSQRNVSSTKKTVSAAVNTLNGVLAVRATTAPHASPVRLTTDQTAPAFRLVKPDETHPLRMNELLRRVNKEIVYLNQKITTGNIHDFNRVYGSFANIEHCYESRHGPRQYSEGFVLWIVQQIKRRPSFCYLTRGKARRMS